MGSRTRSHAQFHQLTPSDNFANRIGPKHMSNVFIKDGEQWKRCTHCNQAYLLIEAFFNRGGTKDGFSSWCRNCNNQYRAKRKQEGGGLAHRYKALGVTPESYRAMHVEQSGVCAICEKPLDKPHLDHDHATNDVRGLLCSSCNQGLGYFKDSPGLLRAAATYLEKHKRSAA